MESNSLSPTLVKKTETQTATQASLIDEEIFLSSLLHSRLTPTEFGECLEEEFNQPIHFYFSSHKEYSVLSVDDSFIYTNPNISSDKDDILPNRRIIWCLPTYEKRNGEIVYYITEYSCD